MVNQVRSQAMYSEKKKEKKGKIRSTFLPNKWWSLLSSWAVRRDDTWAVNMDSKMMPETIHTIAKSRANSDLGVLSP